MNKTLRILNVEDSERDAVLLSRHLSKSGYEVISERVETPADMKAALERQEWDIILCDYTMPNFSALAALSLLKKTGLEIPFIIISGSVGEDLAVSAMLSGANDYLMKDNLARLVPTIERALAEAGNRRAQKQTEEALRASEDRYRDLVENSHDLICTHDLEGRILSVNRAAIKLLGFDQDVLLKRNIREFLFPRFGDEFDNYIAEIRKNHIVQGIVAVQTSTGEKRIWAYTNTLRTEGIEIPIVRGMAHDITEQKRAENALKASETELRALFAAMTDVIAVVDADGKLIKMAPTKPMQLYKPVDEKIGKMLHEIFPKETADSFLTHIRRALVEDTMHKFEYNLPIDGRKVWFEGSISPMTKESVIWIARDITDRKYSENRMRQSEEGYRLLFESNPQPMWVYDVETLGFLEVNDAAIHHYGYSREEFLLMTIKDIRPPEDVPKFLDILLHVPNPYEAAKIWRHRKKDGTIIDSELITHNFTFNRRPARLVLAHDVTERRSLEEQLRQSQKLESIGLLAGGIAHDFNNLLTAINGYSELSLRHLQSGNPLRRNIEEIKKAGDRAASLTRQLLAFSRKQVLQPRILDLNSIVSDLEKMLRRLIGEDIDLQTSFEPNLGSVKADPGQIEQMIMNLVVNARDAMPQGGKLIIETKNYYLDEEYASRHIAVTPGHYVMLAVSDTGIGIDAETQVRMFEPFFTTKELGKGTGLGLSTVYGIVKQSGGSVWVYSEIGRGTSFKVYLPCVNEFGPKEYKPIPEKAEKIRGIETVLLVEDEEIVRKLIHEVLETFGYQVLEAANVGAGLLICEQYKETIQVLITDVVMPEMNGPELASRVLQLRPEIKVLYMSGYTDNAIVHQGLTDKKANFIQKPFTPDNLARKLREILDDPKK